MSEQKTFSTALTKVNNIYMPMIEEQFRGNQLDLDSYSKQCVLNSISAINNVLDSKGVSWNDSQLDQSNITQVLLSVASLKLNASASPNEVYFQLRNVKTEVNGKEVWKKQIEMGIEGDGNDAILSNFGRNVKEVRQYWEVREGDEFEYPKYQGIDVVGPTWVPKGKGKVIRVVYPIIMQSGTVDYHIAEREDVIKNLIAHLNNNLMNETFGIAKSRFKATAEQKEQMNKRKRELLDRAKELGLDEALQDEELRKYMSPAWKDPQSSESMIVRKMRNNIVKKIPKDFGNTFVELMYDKSTDESGERIRKEVNEQKEVIDIEEQEKLKKENEPKPEQLKEKVEKEPEIVDLEIIESDEVPF